MNTITFSDEYESLFIANIDDATVNKIRKFCKDNFKLEFVISDKTKLNIYPRFQSMSIDDDTVTNGISSRFGIIILAHPSDLTQFKLKYLE